MAETACRRGAAEADGRDARRLYGVEPVMTVRERIEMYEPAILPW